jgi:ribosomal protein S2
MVIPGNDDAIRASQLMASLIADAAAEGAELAEARAKDAAKGKEAAKAKAETAKGGEDGE